MLRAREAPPKARPLYADLSAQKSQKLHPLFADFRPTFEKNVVPFCLEVSKNIIAQFTPPLNVPIP